MNSKLGFYQVNNQIFYNKVQAILFANQTLSDVTWDFNISEFKKFSWTTEPETSLRDLYSIRAKQIREQSDYVILMVSGGADSTNMLYSFLDNNIRVDEVIAAAPYSGLKNWKFDPKDTSFNGMISETKFAQLPLMDKISKSHPNIRITLHDYFEDMMTLKTDEWIYENLGHWIHLSGGTRHSLDKFSHIKDLAEGGSKISVVYGIDKPVIYRAVSGNLYTIFMDTATSIITTHFKDRYPNVESVLYYYASDLPELMIKQAHELCRWMYLPENQYARNLLWDRSKSDEFINHPRRGSHWQRSIVPAIYYPTMEHQNMWQADKAGNQGITSGRKMDSWLYKLHGDSKMIQMAESDINLFTKNIDTKYFVSDKMSGFTPCSNYWKIGHESDFMPHNHTQGITIK